MHNLIILLHNLIMKYFEGIKFINSGFSRFYPSTVDKLFLDYYGIQYNHSGRFICSIDHSPPMLVDGPCAFMTIPMKHYNYGTENGKSRCHLFICFNGPRAEEYVKKGLIKRDEDKITRIHDSERFFKNMREVDLALEETPPAYSRAVNLLEALLLQLFEERKLHGTQGDSSLQKKILDLAESIKNTPVLDWDFKKEAEILSLSYPHFRRLFERFIGFPPCHYLRNCRLNLAARDLCAGEKTIAQIAEDSCFYDVHHFSRVFKERFTLPPAAYRREFSH